MDIEIVLEKQPQKFIKKSDEKTRKLIYKALEEIKQLNGDIVKLAGTNGLYRYKIFHYRVIFRIDRNGNVVITVIEINTRTNIKYRRYRQ